MNQSFKKKASPVTNLTTSELTSVGLAPEYETDNPNSRKLGRTRFAVLNTGTDIFRNAELLAKRINLYVQIGHVVRDLTIHIFYSEVTHDSCKLDFTLDVGNVGNSYQFFGRFLTT
jgi:hypothetical protein